MTGVYIYIYIYIGKARRACELYLFFKLRVETARKMIYFQTNDTGLQYNNDTAKFTNTTVFCITFSIYGMAFFPSSFFPQLNAL